MTWSIHTSLSISRLCSDNVANDPNQLGNADVGTIYTFLFWYQFVKLQFGIWLQFAANLYKLLTARRAVSTNLLQISSTPITSCRQHQRPSWRRTHCTHLSSLSVGSLLHQKWYPPASDCLCIALHLGRHRAVSSPTSAWLNYAVFSGTPSAQNAVVLWLHPELAPIQPVACVVDR